MNHKPQQIRQGDVQLQPVASLPEGCKEVPNDKGRIVLAYGEVTGHAHAIADHRYLGATGPRSSAIDVLYEANPTAAGEIAEAAIARARLVVAPNGDRFLEVKEVVHLTHEEHTAHTLNPGIYKLPVQTEYSPEELRRVAD